MCLEAEGFLTIQSPQTGKSLDKAGSISLVTSMSPLPLASSSVPFDTHFINCEMPTSTLDLSEAGMGLTTEDISGPRTLVRRPHPSQLPCWAPLAWPLHSILLTVP